MLASMLSAAPLSGMACAGDAAPPGGQRSIPDPGHRFEMYYTRSDDRTLIARATSDDGKLWTKGVPKRAVVVPGDVGAWDADGVTDPSVIRDADVYRLYYAGESADATEEIGLATSIDGQQWTKHPANPVLRVGAAGSHDSAAVSNPMVLRTDGIYSLWYTAVDAEGTESIGLATSEDGVTWTKLGEGPVFGVGTAGSFYEREASDPGVLRVGQTNWLFFSAVDAGVSFDPLGRRTLGRAVSSDGLQWQAGAAPVLSSSPDPSAFDSLRVTSAEVELVDGEYYMYYVGTSDDEDLPQGSVLPDQFVTRQINVGGIGLAISADGLSWTRFSAPVLTPDSLQPGATVGDPSVLVLSN